ncbi:MAG: hypothetical protein IJY93_01605 [Clostridia bacterium]|nr:hypothetical protein [Clostridia bacterium]
MITESGLTCAELGITSEKLTSPTDLRFYNVRTTSGFSIHGIMRSADDKCFVRFPEEVAEKVSEPVAAHNYFTAGGRIRFKTTSSYVAIKTTSGSDSISTTTPVLVSDGFDMYVKNGNKQVFSGNIMPQVHLNPDGYDGILTLPEGEKEITIYMPLYCRIDELYIGLDSKSTLNSHSDYKYTKPVLYYGSSITEGCGSSRPGMAYTAIVSRKVDTDYISLGFGGSAKGEDAIIEYLATVDCSVFVLDYDHNAPTPEHLAATHEKLYLRFRETHPDTPVIFLHRPVFTSGYHPITGRRKIIYDTYYNARARGEKVFIVDDYHIDDPQLCSEWAVDGVHPNDLGITYMAKYVSDALKYAIEM